MEFNIKRRHIFLLAGFLLFFWACSFFLLFLEKTNRGVFGDMFGAVNALFSGFALLGIVLSILLQQKELSHQRRELIETRNEFKDQNFQTTFYNLLKTQREITKEIEVKTLKIYSNNKEVQDVYTGYEFFYRSKGELIRIFEALKMERFVGYSSEDIEYLSQYCYNEYGESYESDLVFEDGMITIRHSYTLKHYKITENEFNRFKELNMPEQIEMVLRKFLVKHNYAVGHYFRHLYHILLFIKKAKEEKLNWLNRQTLFDEEEKKLEQKAINEEFGNYIKFVQAQLNIPELFLLFYNSFVFPKARELYLEFDLFDVLNSGNLLKKEHADLVPGLKLYSKNKS